MENWILVVFGMQIASCHLEICDSSLIFWKLFPALFAWNIMKGACVQMCECSIHKRLCSMPVNRLHQPQTQWSAQPWLKKHTHCVQYTVQLSLNAEDLMLRTVNVDAQTSIFWSHFATAYINPFTAFTSRGTFLLRYQTGSETQPNARHIARIAMNSFIFQPLQGNPKVWIQAAPVTTANTRIIGAIREEITHTSGE